jgi:hypothetical protein
MTTPMQSTQPVRGLPQVGNQSGKGVEKSDAKNYRGFVAGIFSGVSKLAGEFAFHLVFISMLLF